MTKDFDIDQGNQSTEHVEEKEWKKENLEDRHFEAKHFEDESDDFEDEYDDFDEEEDDFDEEEESRNQIDANPEEIDAYVYRLFAKAEEYRGLEMYDMELRFLFDILKYAPNHPDLWIKIGRAYRVLGNHKMALDAYQKAIMINPSDPFIYGNLGALYIHMGKIESACHHLEKAVETIPEAAPGYATMLANYAMALALDNQKKKAWKYLSKAEKMGYRNGDLIRKKANLGFWDKFFG